MDAKQRRQELRGIMKDYNLSPDDVGEILGKAVGTVQNWRADLKEKYAPPLNQIRLLKLELEARKAKSTNEKTPVATNN